MYWKHKQSALMQSGKWLQALLLTCLCTFVFHEIVMGQNLVPNPSFEEYLNCPYVINAVPYTAAPWVAALGGTPDYYNACMNSWQWQFGVPTNAQGYQEAHTGVAYASIFTYAPGITWVKEFLQVALQEPLEAGECYIVSFYANLTDVNCGSDKMGALLSVDPPWVWMGENPQVQFQGGYLSDTADWVHIFEYYTAVGGEQYITIGNFYTDDDTAGDPACTNTPPFSNYFIDDVAVIPSTDDNPILDLEGPVTACDSFVIDPGIPDAIFEWSDGSTGPTLTVYTSGTYSLVAYFDCAVHTDAIQVTIYNVPPVDLIDNIPIECAWDSYTITLDPDAGEYEWQDGSTGNEYTITGDGTYYVILDDGCDLTSDTLYVDLLEVPQSFTLGADTLLCNGDAIMLSFDPALGDFLWQDQTTDNTYTISTAGTYALTVSNICGEASDEIEVTLIDVPYVNLGPDTTTLCPGETLLLEPAAQNGTYTWQDGSTNTFFEVIETGLYSVSITNACGSDMNAIYVDYLQVPSVELGPSLLLCDGDTLALSSPNNEGNFLWQDGSTNDVFVVTESGTYSLQITNICGQGHDTVDIAFLPQIARPELGPDIALCPGEEAILQTGITGVNYLWNDMSTADTLVVTAAGMYYVQVSDACNTFSDTIHITVENMGPQLDLRPDFLLCQGDTVILDAGISNVTYQWNDNTNLSSISIFNPGLYALTVTNNCGTSSDSILVNDGGPMPVVALGIDTAICMGTSITITPTASNVDTWLWQDGSVLPNFVTTAPGEIHVAVSNNCGDAFDTMQIGLLPAIPIVSLGPDTTLCAGDTLSFLIDITGVDIQWQDGSTDSSIQVTEEGPLYAMISNSCGSSSDTLQISILPEIPLLDLGADQSICPGETIVLNPGITDVMYEWQDGSTGSTLSVTQNATITLVITNDCGSANDTLEISESTDGPQVDLGPDLVACSGDSIVIETNISGVHYDWQDGSVGENYTATTSGSYYVEVSNLCGTDTDTIQVEISGVAPNVYLGPDTILCEGTTLLLSYNADNITTVLWQDGTDAQQLQVQSEGLYILTATNRCGNSIDSVQIGYMEAPDPFDLGSDTILCAGESILLNAPATSNQIVWQDGSTLPQLLVSIANTYILEISNACGEQTDSLVVKIDDKVPTVNLGPDTVLCSGDFIAFDITQHLPAIYLWNTGDETSSLTVMTPGIYSVTVFTECMSASDEIEILAKTDCIPEDSHTAIYIPNIFSPNDDQINDIFSFSFGSGIHVLSLDGSIFDRWGNMIYRSTKIPFTWDGKRNESLMQPGVYVYTLHLTYEAGGRMIKETFTGDVTLLR